MIGTGHTHPVTGHPPLRRRSPEFSPPSPGRSSSVSNRRASRLPALGAALAMLLLVGGVAHAQTSRVLVSNVGKSDDGNLLISTEDLAQGFTTGSDSAGYTLTSIDIHFQSGGSFISAVVRKTNPATGDLVATLTGPSFPLIGSGTQTFTAPSNTSLDASTEYFVVLDNPGGSNGLSSWTTDDDGEDAGGEAGWSINDSSHRRTASSTGSFSASARAIKIRVNGYTKPTSVPADWSLTPTGLTAGEQFRLLFLSSTTRNASSSAIADYNTFVQNRAAAGHTDIQAYSAGFRAVGCTAAVDARDNTSTTYTTTAKGVPIYWLNGTQAADDYEDFYDGDWDDEANDKNESGTDGPDTSQAANRPWTGCAHDGTEAFNTSNVSRALGSSTRVLLGQPNSSATGVGPIRGLSSVTGTSTRPMYGLSGVFRVAANTAPTAAAGAVTTLEDTAYAFGAADFNFSDTDTGDALESVKITSLPAAGTAIVSGDLPKTVGKADIDAGKLTCAPVLNASGTTTFNFKVNDGDDDSALAYLMTVTITAVNDAPTVATEILDQSATVGTVFSYAFPANTFNDVDTGNTLIYTATNADGTPLPAWLIFDDVARTFSGTPQAADAGTVSVKVTASDGNGGSVSDTVDIAVRPAATSVPSNWSLKPTGVAAGGQFRLLFLSSTKRDGSSTAIADYNTFIQARAAAGHADIRANSAGFRVVGCTSAVDARDNTFTKYTSTDKGVPICWLNGTKAVDEYDDFYDGDWDDEANNKDESGTNGLDTSQTGNTPITGCNHDGTEVVVGGVSFSLGRLNVRFATPNVSGSNRGPISSGLTTTASSTRPMYGLSAVFQVAAAVVTNTAPTAAAGVVTTLEDTAYTFGAADFNFSDTDTGDALESVKITSLQTAGTLSVDGMAIGSGDLPKAVSKADIDAGKLTYTPVPDASGSATFNFKVNDSDEDSASAYLMTVTITAVNDAPTVATAIPDQTATVGTSFSYAFPADTFDDVDTGDTLSYSATQADNTLLPTWLTFTATTRTFSGTPQAADAGPASVKVTASDTSSGSVSDTLEGTDAASFDIVTTSGSAQIRIRTGVTYNHEVKSSYTVDVKADDSNGGTDTITVTITVTDVDEPPARPAAPSVSATAGSATSLDVTWTAPSNTGPAITSYDLQYRQGTTGNFTNGPQDVAGTSAAIGSLAPGTSYQVQVRATNAEGDSAWSQSGTGQTSTTVPGAPTGLAATASGTTQIDLSWTAPASDGGAAVSGYQIEWSAAGSDPWTVLAANTGNTNTTYSDTGFAAGTTRHYRVSAINSAGTASGTDDATTGTTVPGAPTGLAATASGTTQIDLSWTAPASDGGTAVSGYQIEWSAAGSDPWTVLAANTGNTNTTYSDTGLTAGTTRHYRVSAINSAGAGDDSADEAARGRCLGGGLLRRAVERDVPGRAGTGNVPGEGDRRLGNGWRRERAARVRDAAGRVRAGRPPDGDRDAGRRRRARVDRELRHERALGRPGARGRCQAAQRVPEHGSVREVGERQAAAAVDGPAGGDAHGRRDGGGLRAHRGEPDVRGGRGRETLLRERIAGRRGGDRRGPADRLRPAAAGRDQERLGAVRDDRVRGGGRGGAGEAVGGAAIADAGLSRAAGRGLAAVAAGLRRVGGGAGRCTGDGGGDGRRGARVRRAAGPGPPGDTGRNGDADVSGGRDAPHPRSGGPAPPLADEPVHNDTGADDPLAEAALPAPLAALSEEALGDADAERLDLSSRNLADISALAGLTGLRELDLRNNALADLGPLAGLTGLRALHLSDNRIEDLSPLAGLTALEQLSLAGNRIEDLAPLTGLAGLRALDLSGNRIADFWPLAGLAALERLNLSGNRVADIATLAGLGGLEVLLLDRNQVADVVALSQLPGLANLRLAGNPVSGAVPLVRLENLRWLWIDPETAPGIETLAAPARQGAGPLWIERTLAQ